MNQSELEQRLRAEAAELTARCPDTPRQRVRRTLLNEPLPRPGWRSAWLPAAALASAAVAGTIGWVALRAGETAVPTQATVSRIALPMPTSTLDQALAGREAALEDEMQRIRADLERIRGWMS